MPDDWQQRAARTEPMASFRVQLNVEGALRRFFSVSTMAGALGPNAFVSEPRLTITTLYPEEDLDLASMQDDGVSHPLLYY